jgi:hypothetical protein
MLEELMTGRLLAGAPADKDLEGALFKGEA